MVNRTRWVAIAAAGFAVVFGGGAALAASGSDNPASDFLGDVANRLGISENKLEDAIQEATIARIDAAVAAGDITKDEGDALKQRVRSGDVPAMLPSFGSPALGLGPVGPDGMFGPGEFAGIDALDIAADYLGMDEADVGTALRDGKSLADLAKDKGKPVEGLEQAIRDAIREDADRAVEDGALTKEQADRLVEKFSDAVDDLVEQTGPPARGRGFHGPGLRVGPLGPLDKGFIPGAVPAGDLVQMAADYLGIDAADIRRELGDGKSLADVAKDKGKSVDGLKRALRNAIREDADKAVEDGAMTKEQADRFVEELGGASTSSSRAISRAGSTSASGGEMATSSSTSGLPPAAPCRDRTTKGAHRSTRQASLAAGLDLKSGGVMAGIHRPWPRTSCKASIDCQNAVRLENPHRSLRRRSSAAAFCALRARSTNGES